MKVEGDLYMESREWERIVDHLLSLVPLFYPQIYASWRIFFSKTYAAIHTQVLLLLHENGTLAVSKSASG